MKNGANISREEGLRLAILSMVHANDISEERGAEKLGITVEELRERLKETN